MFVKNKIKSQTVSKLIPNIVTLMALCAGLTSIKFCFSGKWEWAVAAIVLAALFDALDGRVARFLDGSTQFGIELDSLSDFISFGVAPAILVYLWSLSSFPKLGWSVAMLYAVCLSLRLARFNAMADKDLPKWQSSYFRGIAAPTAAGLVLLPLMFSFYFGYDFNAPAINIGTLLIASVLMVTTIPTYSFKRIKIAQKFVLPIFILVAVFFTLLVTQFWLAMISIISLYCLTIPFSMLSYRKMASDRAIPNQAEEVVNVVSLREGSKKNK